MKSRFAILFLLVAGLGSILAAGAALAAAGPWAENEHSRVRLISAGDALGADGQVRLGLQFELAEGWKTYWRSPGDAGYPPSLDWANSINFETAEMSWPAPHRFELFGFQTYGYAGEVIFPITATTSSLERSALFEAEVSYLLCEEICIPYEETVSLTLPAGAATVSDEAFLIDQFETRVPGPGAGLEITAAYAVADDGRPAIEAHISSALPLEAPDLLVEGLAGAGFLPPKASFNAARTEVVLVTKRDGAVAAGGLDDALTGREVRLTAVDGKRATEASVTLAPPPAAASGVGAAGGLVEGSLLAIIGIALLGGLILNLMPCVLPVLSLKLLSVVGHGGGETRAVRRSFLATAAGVVFSFLLLAAGAVGLKLAGLSVGWGIQFQQPVFLAAMAVIVTFFAYNLFGFFEILLPGWLSTAAAGGQRKGLGGAFATGAFATLLATPCSAPFVGTAVSFALSRAAGEIFAVFAAMGLGLALPYLLVAAAPGLATSLPKPGKWMIYLRWALGLALAGTAVWLLTIIAAQTGLATALAVGGALVAIGAVLLGPRFGLPRPLESALLIALSAGALGLAGVAGGGGTSQVSAEDWPALDRLRIERLVEQGQVVFVDVTADWCITCQANKAVVLDRDPVASALGGEDVALMRGDWTRPDPMISDYLASFGRYGIPFNAVYGPGAPDGVALPELLSSEAVLQALEKARGG